MWKIGSICLNSVLYDIGGDNLAIIADMVAFLNAVELVGYHVIELV